MGPKLKIVKKEHEDDRFARILWVKVSFPLMLKTNSDKIYPYSKEKTELGIEFLSYKFFSSKIDSFDIHEQHSEKLFIGQELKPVTEIILRKNFIKSSEDNVSLRAVKSSLNDKKTFTESPARYPDLNT